MLVLTIFIIHLDYFFLKVTETNKAPLKGIFSFTETNWEMFLEFQNKTFYTMKLLLLYYFCGLSNGSLSRKKSQVWDWWYKNQNAENKAW